jgi:biotin operon repressor
MFFEAYSFFFKRRSRKVLEATSDSILSAQEISERTGMSKSKTDGAIQTLEEKGYLSSGYLMPGGTKIYRITEPGKAALAGV